MALKIRRGTEAQRSSIQFALGELVWTTDTYRLYVGDGIQTGGWNIAKNLGGTGLSFNPATERLDVDYNGLNSDQVTEGSNHLFFTADRAQDAVGTALTSGNSYNVGITFSYDDVNARITAEVASGSGLPSQSGQTGKYLKTDGSVLSWETIAAAGITSVSQDTSPALGGNLSLSSHNITGTGNINISGNVTAAQVTLSALVLGSNTNVTGGPVNYLGVQSNFINSNPSGAGGTSFVNFLTASSDGLAAPVVLAKARGSVFSPQAVQSTDAIAKIQANAFTGAAFTPSASITCSIDGTVGAGIAPSKWTVTASNSIGDQVTALTIKSTEVLFGVAPVVPAYGNDTARNAAIPTPVPGMIILNGSTFQGWNGTAWATLG